MDIQAHLLQHINGLLVVFNKNIVLEKIAKVTVSETVVHKFEFHIYPSFLKTN